VKASLKYRIVAVFADKYPLKDLCRVLSVSYSGYYKWKRRQDLPDRDESLLELTLSPSPAIRSSSRSRLCEKDRKVTLKCQSPLVPSGAGRLRAGLPEMYRRSLV